MSVEIKGLSKFFGNQKAVDEISFSADKGEILGFLGPNGAGKSTTMKVITSYLPPDEGEVVVEGLDVTKSPMEVRKLIGYLPEHNPLYLDMYVHEYLSFIAGLHAIKGNRRKERVSEMIHTVGLEREQNKKIGALSKGYRQRVGLAQALIHDPKVLILDEPTTGLDPNQIVEIRQVIKNLSKEKTVIFSTHIMQEVQSICTRAVIINKGKIVADQSIAALKGMSQSGIMITVELSEAADFMIFDELEFVTGITPLTTTKVQLSASGDKDFRADLFRFAASKGLVLVELKQEEVSLEDVFQYLTSK
jgi:ABC-2 type transport system ATP-binding protein